MNRREMLKGMMALPVATCIPAFTAAPAKANPHTFGTFTGSTLHGGHGIYIQQGNVEHTFTFYRTTPDDWVRLVHKGEEMLIENNTPEPVTINLPRDDEVRVDCELEHQSMENVTIKNCDRIEIISECE